jgi:hypothetical protein
VIQTLHSDVTLPRILEGRKNGHLAQTWYGPKIPENLRPISISSRAGYLFEKDILKIVQRHTTQCKSVWFSCMSQHFNVWGLWTTWPKFQQYAYGCGILGYRKAFHTTWHPGLLYKLSKLHFSTSLLKLISSFLSNRKFKVSVEGKMCTPREIQAGVPQGSVLSPTLYFAYKLFPQSPGVHLALFADDKCIYIPQFVKTVMFSGKCSAASLPWSRNVSAGT